MNKSIKKMILILAVSLFAFFFYALVSVAEKSTVIKGKPFPHIKLTAPTDKPSQNYLGLSGEPEFSIEDIKGELVIVEIMNIYCHSCQSKAPINNKLYAQIQSDPEIKGRIKMLAIAVGSMDMHIKMFKDEYNTPYPMIPDPKLAVYDLMENGPVPQTLYILKNNEKKTNVVSEIKIGIVPDSTEIVKHIKELLNCDTTLYVEQDKDTGKTPIEKVEPILSGEALSNKIKAAFQSFGKPMKDYQLITLENGQKIHSAVVPKSGMNERVFAVNISRSVPCDVCHDIHFFYLFEKSGKILQLVPLELSKYDNEEWDDDDIDFIRRRTVGRYLFEPFDFNPDVDAVSSATISSSMIFKSFNEGKLIYRGLKQKGYL